MTHLVHTAPFSVVVEEMEARPVVLLVPGAIERDDGAGGKGGGNAGSEPDPAIVKGICRLIA
jgi:hypothetical protein